MIRLPSEFRRVVIALVLFGISFGYVEAAVVAYLRAIYEPIRQRVRDHRIPGDLFPLLRLDDLSSLDRERTASDPTKGAGITHKHRLYTELAREAATLAMLGSVALVAARNFREWMAGFVLAFGVWDISFYVFLKMLLDWPASLMTWDILFLLPVPWVGPVITPVTIAVVMMVCGAMVLWRERDGRPVAFAPGHWGIIVLGGVIIVVAFCWDWRNILAGGYPSPFNWPVYVSGLLTAVAGFVHGFRSRRSPSRLTPPIGPAPMGRDGKP